MSRRPSQGPRRAQIHPSKTWAGDAATGATATTVATIPTATPTAATIPAIATLTAATILATATPTAATILITIPLPTTTAAQASTSGSGVTAGGVGSAL